jgi:hypothetical protein
MQFFGKTLHGFRYQKLIGSSHLAAFSIGIQRLVADKAYPPRFEVPKEEA